MKFTAAALAALLGSASASKNLVANGSFEQNNIRPGSWTFIKSATVPGWTPYTTGADFELWGRGFGGITPADGNNILELDVHGASRGTDGIYQYIETIEGKQYEISFSIRARGRNVKSASEAVVLEWNGVKPSNSGYYATKYGAWEHVKVIVKGTGKDKLLFREAKGVAGANDSLGPLLDNIVVKEYMPVKSNMCGPDNMVLNCSFEETYVKPNTFKWFPEGEVPGWKSLKGEPLELWGENFHGVKASRGKNHLEIDAHSKKLDGVYQYIETVKDQMYKITFDVRARGSKFNSDDEAVVLEWNGVKPSIRGYRATKRGEWTTHTAIVKGTGAMDKLLFRESTSCGGNDSTGPFLDSIHMSPFTPTPRSTTKPAPECSADNMIKNCSFEENDIEENSYTYVKGPNVPGWTSLHGEPIEFWGTGFLKVPASHGSNFIEMDAHRGKTDGIYQLVKTEKGKKYRVSFDVRARSKTVKGDDEAVVFEFNGKKTEHHGYHAKNAGEWTTHTVVVTGTGGQDKITFRETTTDAGDDSTGPFLDNISMKAIKETTTRTTTKTSCGAGNLIKNCSFEESDVRRGGLKFVKPADFPSWESLNGDRLELWGTGFKRVPASHGNTFLEMDNSRSKKTDGIYQYVETVKGATYSISFDVRARGSKVVSDDEAVVLEFNGKKLKVHGHHAANAGEWTRHTMTVVGTGGKDKVTFRETTTPKGNDSTGPFLDNIYMRKTLEPQVKVQPKPMICFPKKVDDCGIDGNMVTNCSFEANPVKPGTMAWFGPDAVTGWKSLNGQDLELWGKDFRSVPAAHGSQFLELDAHKNKATDGIFQYVKTVKGQEYVISFDVRARSSKTNTDDEAVVFEYNGVKLANRGYHAKKAGEWTTHTLVVMGTGESDKLTFRETTTPCGNDSTGPFLDNISMMPKKPNMMIKTGGKPTQSTSCGEIDGNLVKNCSFEGTKVKGNTFKWFKPDDVPYWRSMNGQDIELWGEGFLGVRASDGYNLIEIDSHKASRTSTDGIFQVLETVAGKKYVVTFDMRARGNSVNTDDEAVVLMWNDKKTEHKGYRATRKGEWTTHSVTVTAVGKDKLTFRETTTSSGNDSTGPFLDNISVVALDPTVRSAAKDDCGADNLIKNCSFESNQLSGRTYKVFEPSDVPVWKSLRGQKFELWGSGFLGVPATDGNTFMELDNGRGEVDGIYQMVQTEKGVVYEISYDMRARGKSLKTDDEAVVVEFNDKKLIYHGQHAEEAGEWTRNKVVVTGTGGLDKVTFRETTTRSGNDGSGPFLDNIAMKAVLVKKLPVVLDDCGEDNIVLNCSFERNPIRPGTFTWLGADQVLGWSSLEGEPLEFWGNGFKGVKAPHGQNFLELDSHSKGLDGIYQVLKTEKDQLYTVEFDVRARGNKANSNDESVYLLWNDKVPKASGYSATKAGEWTTVSAIVMGTGEDKLILRESTTASDSTGPFIDHIRVTPTEATTTRSDKNPDDCGKGNMVSNCSFEANIVPDSSMLRFNADDVPGWKSLKGETLEFWSSGFSCSSLGPVEATQGNVFLEIDNHGAKGELDGIYQMIKTKEGQYYSIRFDMRARGKNVKSDDESIVVEWNGKKLEHHGYKAQTAGKWTTITVLVLGTGGEDKLTFRESTTKGADDGSGPFLDNIYMVPTDKIPLSSSDGDCDPANMIENCSFEANVVPDASMRRFAASAIHGWKSLSGQTIELWSNGFGRDSEGPAVASQGTVFLELDNHKSSAIDGVYQVIKTKKDQKYSISFDIRARSNKLDTNDEAVVLEFNGKKLENHGYRATKAGEWTSVTAIVTGTGGEDKVTFRESTSRSANDGTGPFLDNVVMLPIEPKPKSGTKPTDCGVVGNLVENCSFELNNIPDRKWSFVKADAVPGWESNTGSTLELWGDLMANVPAPHGKNFLELDVHGGKGLDGVYQYIQTKAGQEYEVTFKVRARTPSRYCRPDEAIHFLWNGASAKATGFTAKKGGVWTTAKAVVTGTGGKDKLMFRESTERRGSDGTGPFLDEVTVVAIATKATPTDDADNCGEKDNMVANCSFEQTKVPAKTWLLYDEKDVPGWKSLNGEKLELWGKDFLGVEAPDGNIIHEIDAHRSGSKTDGIYQFVQTEKDKLYSVTFSIRARGNKPDTDDEAVVFEFNGVKLEHKGYRAAAAGEWTVITAIVKGTGGKDKITFRETTTDAGDDSTGPFLDKIIMVPTTDTRSTTKPPFDPCADNLLINCSFEEGVAKGTYKFMSPSDVEGWKSLNGNDLEIWGKGTSGVQPKEGSNFLELDNNASEKLDGVYQEVKTDKDQKYSITFSVRARGKDLESDDEAVVLEFNGEKIDSFTATKYKEWTTVTAVVTGTGGTDKVLFRETSTKSGNDGSGPFLDFAKMIPVKPSPVADVDCGADNLVKNCSFETGVPPSTTLETPSIDGWKPILDTNIEIWGDGNAGVKAPHGKNFVELDNNGSGDLDGIWQEIKTVKGQDYKLTFDIRSRSRSDTGEVVVVTWNGEKPKAEGYKAGGSDWSTKSAIVTGTGENDKLVFREIKSDSDGSGPLLDNIRLVPIPSPNPASDCGSPDNMVINCSFEGNLVPEKSMLQFGEEHVPGWHAYKRTKLELWGDKFGGVSPSDGKVFLELDNAKTGALDGVYQYLQTEKGQYYKVTFDIRARGKSVDTNDEAVVLEWNDRKPKNDGYRAKKVGEWTRVHAYVMGSGRSDKLLFRESKTHSDGSGPFLDNISVVPVSDPFEPSVSISNGVYLGHNNGETCNNAGHYAEGPKGTKVTYCFTVKNTGDTYLSNVKVEDKTLDFSKESIGSLAPGGTVTVFFPFKITDTIKNVAKVTGNPTDKFGQDIPGLDDAVAQSTDNSSVGVGLTTLAPTDAPTSAAPTASPSAAPSAALASSMTVENTAYIGGDDNGAGCATATKSVKALVGTKITYCFTVTNTGDLPLTGIVVEDKDLDFKDDSIGKLLPGDSATVYFTTTVDGDNTNEVVATGKPTSKTGEKLPGRDDVIAKVTDSSEVNVIKPDPNVVITNTAYVGDDLGVSCGTKDAAKLNAKVGDNVVFCFKVENTGNTALSNVIIAIPSIDFKSNAVGTLAPGDSQEVDFVYQGVKGSMEAKATVSANPTMPDGSSMSDPVLADSMAKIVVADTKSGSKPTFGSCIETNWKNAGNEEELLCATRDIFLESGAADKPVQCTVGDKVKVTVDGSIRFKDLTPRYDVAWYVATDGGDAMTGTCSLTALGKGAAADYSIVQSSGSDKVVGSVVWDAADTGDGDACGDVLIPNGTDGANLDTPFVVDLELPCEDDNEDGLLDFAVCFTWRQDCNNDVCSFEAVIPGNPTTGCYCTRVDISNTEVDVPSADPIQPC